MKNIFIYTSVLFLFLSGYVSGEVIDLTGISAKDEFIELGRRISYAGVISIQVADDIPYTIASLRSKVPFGVAVDMFNSYLENNNVKGKMFPCPFCPPGKLRYVWFGYVGDREQKVVIDYAGSSGEILINVSSDIDESTFKRHKSTFTDYYTEFSNLAGNPTDKYETIMGNSMSAMLIYDITDSPQKEVESAVRKLTSAGWKHMLGQIFSAKKNESIAILTKDGYNAAVVCTEDSLVVNIIPRGSAI